MCVRVHIYVCVHVDTALLCSPTSPTVGWHPIVAERTLLRFGRTVSQCHWSHRHGKRDITATTKSPTAIPLAPHLQRDIHEIPIAMTPCAESNTCVRRLPLSPGNPYSAIRTPLPPCVVACTLLFAFKSSAGTQTYTPSMSCSRHHPQTDPIWLLSYDAFVRAPPRSRPGTETRAAICIAVCVAVSPCRSRAVLVQTDLCALVPEDLLR